MTKSQFSYHPLAWLFCSRQLNNLIDKVQERGLRLISNDHQSSSQILLNMCNEFSVHRKSLQTLIIQTYNAGKWRSEKHRIWTLFTQCLIIKFYEIFLGRQLDIILKLAYGKSGTRDPKTHKWNPGPGTQFDQVGPGTRDP